jgi:hypothetical protein
VFHGIRQADARGLPVFTGGSGLRYPRAEIAVGTFCVKAYMVKFHGSLLKIVADATVPEAVFHCTVDGRKLGMDKGILEPVLV